MQEADDGKYDADESGLLSHVRKFNEFPCDAPMSYEALFTFLFIEHVLDP